MILYIIKNDNPFQKIFYFDMKQNSLINISHVNK